MAEIIAQKTMLKKKVMFCDEQWLVKEILKFRRLRQLWLVCWVPAAFLLYVGFNEMEGVLIPFWILAFLSIAWTLVGFCAIAYKYHRLIVAAERKPKFQDLITLSINTTNRNANNR